MPRPRSRLAVSSLLTIVALTVAVAVVNVSHDATATANGVAAKTKARFSASLPAPTGPYPIGTVAWELPGTGRPDPWRPGRDRDLTVQLWYPADDPRAQGVGRPDAANLAPWAHPNVARHAAQRYGFAPESLVELRGHATEAAPVRADGGALPVLVFSPGDGGNRTDNTALTEELASHGYLVVSIDHLGDALEGSTQDGQLVARTKPELPEDIRPEELGGPAVVTQVDVRVADVRAVLDALGRVRTADRGEPAGLPDRIDLGRIGVFGHSLGGATTAGAMFVDDRIRAGANLDGLVAGPVAAEGLGRPFLVLRQPQHTTRIDPSWRTFLPALRGWHRLVTIAGSGHYSFADLGLWTRQAGVDLRTTEETYRFNFGTGDNRRATVLVRQLLVGFFDVHLRDRPVPPVLAGPTAGSPELTFG
jgi:predicted dienelactone hydrolase